MDLTYLRVREAEGAEEATPSLVPVYETIQLAAAPGSGFRSSQADDKSGIGKASVDFKHVVITPKAAPEGALKVEQISGEWSNSLNEKKLNVVRALLNVGPVTSGDAGLPYLPVSLTLDATYEGAMPKTAQTISGIQSPESAMKLTSFSLTSKEASVKASANFTANASDVLPVGTASLSLANVPFMLSELRKYRVLNDQTSPLVEQVLQRMTGVPIAEMTDVTIPIERVRGGSFTIGKTTFEELFALFLKEALQVKQGGEATIPEGLKPPLVPNLPPADKPRAAPIEIPDHGVRG